MIIDKSLTVMGAGVANTTVNGDTTGDGVGDGSVFTIRDNANVALSA